MRRLNRGALIATASVQTFLLAGILCVLASFLSITSKGTWLEQVVVQVEAPPDWLGEGAGTGAVVRVNAATVRALGPTELGELTPLRERGRVRALLSRLHDLGGDGLVVVPEDGVSTQQLVWLTEDAMTAGFAGVAVRLEE